MNQTWKIVLAVIITAVIVGGGVYYWQNSKTSSRIPVAEETGNVIEELPIANEPIKQPKAVTETAESADETASWKTYTNMGITIKYPNDGTYSIETRDNGFTVTQAQPGNRVLVRKTNDSSALSGEFTTKVINGKTYMEKHSEGEGNGYSYIIERNGQFYHFTSVWGPTNEVFELMMTTVAFE